MTNRRVAFVACATLLGCSATIRGSVDDVISPATDAPATDTPTPPDRPPSIDAQAIDAPSNPDGPPADLPPPPPIDVPSDTPSVDRAPLDVSATDRADAGCPPGTMLCLGRCLPRECMADFGDCDLDYCRNGCETDLSRSASNCGSCGRACLAPPGAIAACVAGVCVPSPLGVCGFADCNGDPADGAETDTRTSVCHCGGCGRACGAANGVATARCEACACRITCHPTYGNCDADAANGCETRTLSDRANCGTCGHRCGEGEACVEGRCVTESLLAICAGETVDLRSDVRHCGACGRLCPPSQVCSAGRCNAACTDTTAVRCGADTCVSLTSNGRHCGHCDNVCVAGMLCTEGSCFFDCTPAMTVCSRRCSNLQTDTLNCGSCGRTCGQGARCVDGACVGGVCSAP